MAVKRLYSHFTKYITLVCILIILSLPAIYMYKFIGSDDNHPLFATLLFCTPLCFLLSLIRNKWLFALVFTLAMIMSCIESVTVLMFQSYINAGNILSIINTTAEESLGFASTTGCILIIYPPLHIFIWGIGIYYHKCNHKIKYDIIALGTSLIIAFVYIYYDRNFVKGKDSATFRFYANRYLLASPPYNILLQTYNAIESLTLRSMSKEAESMSFHARRDKNVDNKEIYVLAIGESIRYDNLSLGGYNRSTTPLLEQQENITLFSNYYSTANLTAYSIPQILTRATPSTFGLSFKEKSLFAPFKECGFKTFAICCKNLLHYESYLTTGIDGLFSVENDADISNIVDSITGIHPKAFFVIQFLGCHGPYDNFDKECDVYHPNHVSDNRPWADRVAVKNSYDNTIVYMDYNVCNIIKSIDKPEAEAALLMVSDHGEAFLPGTSGHGNSCNPNKEEYHVPLIFWHSDLWASGNQKKRENIEKNKNFPINADNVFYSVCDMAAIKIAPEYAHEKWSIFADSIEFHERLLLVPDGKNYIVLK